MKEQIPEKITFQGLIRSVQPRSNVWRYRLDNRTHSLTGYNLFLTGVANGVEGFCYGPKSCKNYAMGRPRAVPYKDCGSSYDDGWLDDICTENRGWDD